MRSMSDGFMLSTTVILALSSRSSAMRHTERSTSTTSGLRATILLTRMRTCSASCCTSESKTEMRPSMCSDSRPQLKSSMRGFGIELRIFLCATFLVNARPSMKWHSRTVPPGTFLILTYSRMLILGSSFGSHASRNGMLTLLTHSSANRRMVATHSMPKPSLSTCCTISWFRCCSHK